MEEEKGFYKLEPSAKGRPQLIHGTFLLNKDWTLDVKLKDTYTYPVDGWRYFDTLNEACAHYEVSGDDWREILFPTEIEEIEVL